MTDFNPERQIPGQIIGLLSDFLNKHCSSHADLNSIFQIAGAPNDKKPPQGHQGPMYRSEYWNMKRRVDTWLGATNEYHKDPLSVLGEILKNYMDDESSASRYEERLNEIRETLAKTGWQYHRGGRITPLDVSSPATQSLEEIVEKEGLPAIQKEIRRALENVEKDPKTALTSANSVMEATFKIYLQHRNISYKETENAISLWEKVAADIGIHHKNMESKEMKKVGSGLSKIVEGVMLSRSKEFPPHGKTEELPAITPPLARLAIHAAHTLCVYVLEAKER